MMTRYREQYDLPILFQLHCRAKGPSSDQGDPFAFFLPISQKEING